MRRLLIYVFFVIIVFSLVRPAKAVTDCSGIDDASRCTTCDLCGYCLNQTPPASWEGCRNCLYPDLTGSPAEENETLRVEPTTHQAPTSYPGHWYTQLGCISANIGGFSEQGAAGNVIQTLLNLLFGATGGVAFIYIIYGSFIVLTSQADSEKINYGRRLILGAVVGLVFSLSAVFIINMIGGQILKIPGFGQEITPTP
jgi:hypothetical protein